MQTTGSRLLIIFTFVCVVLIALSGYVLKIEQSFSKEGFLNSDSEIEIWVNTDELNFIATSKNLNLSYQDLPFKIQSFKILESQNKSYRLKIFLEDFSSSDAKSQEISIKIFAEPKNLWEYFVEMIRGFFGKRNF